MATRRDSRPHKPLLLLIMIGRFVNSGRRQASFAEVEEQLARLIDEYGPPGARPTPENPFHHLQNDEGIWEVHTSDGSPWPGSRRGELRRVGIGTLTPEFAEAMSDPATRAAAVGILLSEFGEAYQSDLLDEVGLGGGPLDLTVVSDTIRRRDPGFREAVLTAYERRCAFCGFDGRLADRSIGLDAAHVRWHSHGGPDEVANGLSLCSFHHKLLDLGVLGLTPDHTIAVSQRFSGHGEAAARLVLDLVGKSIHEPQTGQPPVHDRHIEWHNEQVFHGPGRLAV